MAAITLVRGLVSDPLVDVRRLIEWQAFNVCAGNSDGHGKNLSILHDRAGARLAPFYDLLATRYYPSLDRFLAMAVGGGRDPDRLARAALPAEVPMQEAVFNVAHGALLAVGLATGDPGLITQGLADRLHQDRRAHLFPRSAELVRDAAGLGALGATISGAGPTVLLWTLQDATGAVIQRVRPRTEGWADVIRAPFAPQGADVREL